jgi:hypothetical protein
MTQAEDVEREPLFYEPGGNWYLLLLGPAAAVTMILIQMSGHHGVGLLVPAVFMVMISLFLAIQIKAARIHTSVELTEDALRQGTETILLSEIVKIYPEAENTVESGEPLEPWQEARTLGEINGVPRRRVGIGLKLTGGRTAQAWARRHRDLRAALTPLVQERVRPAQSDIADIADIEDGQDADDAGSSQ